MLVRVEDVVCILQNKTKKLQSQIKKNYPYSGYQNKDNSFIKRIKEKSTPYTGKCKNKNIILQYSLQ